MIGSTHLPGSSVGKYMYLVRIQEVAGSNHAQGSSFFSKSLAALGVYICLAFSCIYMYMYTVHCSMFVCICLCL